LRGLESRFKSPCDYEENILQAFPCFQAIIKRISLKLIQAIVIVNLAGGSGEFGTSAAG
jgi:hypothetical protein